MKHRNRCKPQHTTAEQRSLAVIQTFQPFPRTGLLGDSLDLPLSDLNDRVCDFRGTAYSYIATSVKLNRDTKCFEQHGSGPNFQGDVFTLCTCKHQMRSRLSAQEWQNDVWIAGFTSRSRPCNRHWLFYLAKVQSAYESYSDLWSKLNTHTRNAKAANTHFLGDVFQPKKPGLTGNARYSPMKYVKPLVHAHRRYLTDSRWKKDIHYQNVSMSKQPPLLVADRHFTFLWEVPVIFFVHNHCRDYHKWPSLQQLINNLEAS